MMKQAKTMGARGGYRGSARRLILAAALVGSLVTASPSPAAAETDLAPCSFSGSFGLRQQLTDPFVLVAVYSVYATASVSGCASGAIDVVAVPVTGGTPATCTILIPDTPTGTSMSCESAAGIGGITAETSFIITAVGVGANSSGVVATGFRTCPGFIEPGVRTSSPCSISSSSIG